MNTVAEFTFKCSWSPCGRAIHIPTVPNRGIFYVCSCGTEYEQVAFPPMLQICVHRAVPPFRESGDVA